MDEKITITITFFMSHDGQYCKTQQKNFVGELTQKLVIGTVGSQIEVMTGVAICNTNL